MNAHVIGIEGICYSHLEFDKVDDKVPVTPLEGSTCKDFQAFSTVTGEKSHVLSAAVTHVCPREFSVFLNLFDFNKTPNYIPVLLCRCAKINAYN
jgi:hypothetical protein